MRCTVGLLSCVQIHRAHLWQESDSRGVDCQVSGLCRPSRVLFTVNDESGKRLSMTVTGASILTGVGRAISDISKSGVDRLIILTNLLRLDRQIVA